MNNAPLQKAHAWEATGVTGYPITHPIVGQVDFFTKFKSYLDLVAGEDNRFAQVFAVVAPWGVGKSRLGYEIVAQVNGTSRGWRYRLSGGALADAHIFESDAVREQYLALYIRYSQIAHPQLNLDNWFAPAVYKALTPLAKASFDGSIQHQIAKQSHARLVADGFDAARLAEAMELGKHDEAAIYGDTALATRLCNAAYDVLKTLGIRYMTVVVDELETAAERATGGMEEDEKRTMDGRAITMLRRAVEGLGRKEIETVSKAVKEEDARARFPWLRFVVLCSPVIGEELKEVQSTNRRFEIVDLAKNAFSDVRAFVRSLEGEGRLLRPYPVGLVEAAYMMSGGNFGWFNVIMAVVDQVLRGYPAGATVAVDAVFRKAIEVSNRIASYVLDRRALDEVEVAPELRAQVERLVLGQLPVPTGELEAWPSLLGARNAHGEPVAIRFQRATWRIQDCTQTLIRNRFQRIAGTSRWTAPGIPDEIDLERLLEDISTVAVREVGEAGTSQTEPGQWAMLLPANLADFLQLVDLLHPHAATEETARVLWQELVGRGNVADERTTHIGPSVEMLRRLDIRLRKASGSQVLRDPDENARYGAAIDRLRQSESERARYVLTGAMRLLDEHWTYDPEPVTLGSSVAIRTNKDKGFLDHKGLSLHPKEMAVLAWAPGDAQLLELVRAVAEHQKSEGRYPVVVFTSDYDLAARFEGAVRPEYAKALGYVLVVHVNSGEEAALWSMGLPTSVMVDFRLRRDGFVTRFSERLNRIKTPLARRIREWRHAVNRRGGIAWPLKPVGTLKEAARKRIVDGWITIRLEKGAVPIEDAVGLRIDYAALTAEVDKLGLSASAGPKNYGREDSAGLWDGEGSEARPAVPPFLVKSIVLPMLTDKRDLDLGAARRDWLWGYVWDGNKPKDIFDEWMGLACDLGWAEQVGEGKETRFGLVTREALRSRVQEARNWLGGGFVKTYEMLLAILGGYTINNWLRPGGGTKYLDADRDLKRAELAMNELDALEATPPAASEDWATMERWFVAATKARRGVLGLVNKVYDRKAYAEAQPDLEMKSLDFNDDEVPLWLRMKRAEHFGTEVIDTSRAIRKRIIWTREAMETAILGQGFFPLSLFTRPLLKIDHIVDPGMVGEDAAATTQRAQHAKVDTLAYYLREVRVAEAIAALVALAREVGIEGREQRPLEALGGEIGRAWNDFRVRVGAVRADLLDLDMKIMALSDALVGTPADFELPAGTRLADVIGRPQTILSVFDSTLAEEVEELLEQHDESMNHGSFAPLMHDARRTLLEPAEASTKALAIRVRTLENAVAGYRQALIDHPELKAVRSALLPLARVFGRSVSAAPVLDDLAERSLNTGVAYVAAVLARWQAEGTAMLADVGVAFDEWRSIVVAIERGANPVMSDVAASRLVEQGLLRRTYALGGDR